MQELLKLIRDQMLIVDHKLRIDAGLLKGHISNIEEKCSDAEFACPLGVSRDSDNESLVSRMESDLRGISSDDRGIAQNSPTQGSELGRNPTKRPREESDAPGITLSPIAHIDKSETFRLPVEEMIIQQTHEAFHQGPQASTEVTATLSAALGEKLELADQPRGSLLGIRVEDFDGLVKFQDGNRLSPS